MRFTVVAVAAGVLIGLATGGGFRHLAGRSLRSWSLLFSGLALQAVGSTMESKLGLALVVTSYGLLVAFALANASMVGMWLVALGIALNLVVIAVNGGMPVRPSAVVVAGIADSTELEVIDLGPKRHIERPTDRLTGLGDVIPVRPLSEVLSFGDVMMNVGVANVLAHLLRPSRRRAGPLPPDDRVAAGAFPPW
jgi:hypothetical protein